MSISEPPSLALLAPEIRDRILAYTPKTLTAEQWRALRPQVVEVVARSDPHGPVEARVLCSNLCALMAAFIDEVSEPTVDALLTRVNVARFQEMCRRDGKSDMSLAQRRSALRRLLDAKSGLPPRAKRRPRRGDRVAPTGPAGYTVEELARLAALASQAPADIGRVIRHTIVLGVRHGVVGPATRALVRNGDQLTTGDRSITLSARDMATLGDVAGVARHDADAARAFIKEHGDGLELRVERLRATWLVSVLRRQANQQPLARLMVEQHIGIRGVARAMGLLDEPTGDELALLRDV
jgi:hypothetical protein